MVRFLKLFMPVVVVVILVVFFTFFDNQTSAQTLSCGEAEGDVILSIDRSGSMTDSSGGANSKMNAAKVAAASFVNTLSGDTRNRVGVTSYATQASIDQELTGDYQSAKDAIWALSPANRTCIECGAYKSNLAIKQKGRAGVKNVVILLTDGRANVIRGSNDKVGINLAEKKALAEVKKGYAESGTVYFTIGLGKDINASFLKKIASVTGGKYYASPSTDQLDTIYQQISQIIAEGSISGVVYNDANENGTLDAGENNLEGWTIRLEQTGTATKSSTSDVAGGYTFGNLCDGSYKVSETLKTGWSQTEPAGTPDYSLNLTGGITLANTNFGNALDPLPPSTPTCVRNTPTLVVTPGTVSGEAGVEQVFDVKITNNDSSECSPSVFNISGIISNYPLWDVTLDQEEFLLNPGKTGNTKMRVTPPSGAQDGSFTITVIAQQVDGPQLTQNVNYVVSNPGITPIPVTPTTVPNTPTEIPATPTIIPVTPVPGCVKNAPLLEVLFGDSIKTYPGGFASYTLQITNLNSEECGTGYFYFTIDQASLPNETWEDWTVDNDYFNLDPGESFSQDVRFYPPFSTPAETINPEVLTAEFGTENISKKKLTLIIKDKTVLNIAIGADGIGTTSRIPLGGNKNPLHQNRNYKVSLFDTGDNSQTYTNEHTFTYNPIEQLFESTIFLPFDYEIPSGRYNIYVEGPQYLRAQFPSSVSITEETINNIKSENFNLIAGDINKNDQSFNSIDLLDYNVLISCSIYSNDVTTCHSDRNFLNWSDLNDDGIVDEDDYTLWLKELANQPGAVLPGI